jgi:subtilase family serine protease
MALLKAIPSSLAAAGCIALAAVGISATTNPATADVHADLAAQQIRISSGAVHAGAAAAAPLTTQQCLTQYGVSCYGARQIQSAYNLRTLYSKGVTGRGQTIVIVDAFGSPTIAHDLAVFDHTYRLPAPPSLHVIQPAGSFTWQANDTDEGWAGETTLDVEYAHTIAPGANILLVETPVSEEEGTSGFPEIETAEKYVIDHHLGGVISQSFSATEETFPSKQSLLALRGAYTDAYAKGVTVLAASGDDGAADSQYNEVDYYLHPVTSWPDSDPLVTGVGGTQLHLDAAGQRTAPDNVWNDTYNIAAQQFVYGSNGPNPIAGGGGKSVVFSRPGYQNGVASVVGSQRGVPDISMSGACDGAVNIYQSFAGSPAGWYPTCGTSEATPLFAGIVSLADQVAGHPLGLINPSLYRLSAAHAPGIVDITKGNNTVGFTQDGKLDTITGFNATPGYDLASGVGTVNAAYFVPELARLG